jgi:hypothetical protein
MLEKQHEDKSTPGNRDWNFSFWFTARDPTLAWRADSSPQRRQKHYKDFSSRVDSNRTVRFWAVEIAFRTRAVLYSLGNRHEQRYLYEIKTAFRKRIFLSASK